jgi:glycosyltransferase involved in cell wall biosynthesis
LNQDFADISVIIPAYNRAGLIGETLRSLLNQTIPAKEIIVVDDGSTDGTAEAAEREFSVFREQFSALQKPSSVFSVPSVVKPSLRVIRQQNAGPGAARNRGLAEATGEFIHFFDSDDIAALNKHEVLLRAILETRADIAYGPWAKGRFLPAEKLKDFLTTDDTDNHGYQKNQHGNAQGTCAGAAFSNRFTSELARNCENASPTRSASGPAEALFADHGEIGSAGGNQLADSKEFLECQSQAGLQMDNQKDPTIRTANDPSASGEYSSSVFIRDIRGSKYSLPLNFVPEGPVLQAWGFPHGDLVRALLTNWSVVPHACLFRRSILEKAGGFPEDIWVGEDQLLFLRCLLAGAKVAHTPETIVFYRLGNDPGKLTATGAAQKRHARDWARFLLKAGEEVSTAECRVAGKRICLTTEDTESTEGEEAEAGPCLDKPSGVALSNPYKSELARDSENTSLTRSADHLLASRKQSDENPVNLVNPVKNCFGFRLRAYEAWRDLEKFFPAEEGELKNELQRIWKRNWFSGSRFQVSGFVLRKLAGLKLRVLGYRENASFRCRKFSVVGGESGVAANQKN